MKTIQIDEEVYAYIQSVAISYVESTPNETLRRIFLDKPEKINKSVSSSQKLRKKPKASLLKLINAGLLRNNQKLYLFDYQGNKIDGYEATISNAEVIWENRNYSMSELAKILLKKQGYESNSVRGPAHWYTADGNSIKDIWERYLGTTG